MICPHCGEDNVPGSEDCASCHQDLTQLDRPSAQDSVERSLMHDPVGILHPRPPVTVAPTASIDQAVRIMLERNLGALLVVGADGKLLGIFSERDLLSKVAGRHEVYADLPVGRFMTPDPETVTAQDSLAFALRAMDIGGYRHLPVLTDGLPSGVISVRDVLRHITRLCRQPKTRSRAGKPTKRGADPGLSEGDHV